MIADTRPQLTKLTIQNYRSLKSVEIDFHDPMTVLIGKNAAGKSTILDVFEFVAQAMSDAQKAIASRGGSLADVTWARQSNLDIQFSFHFSVPADARAALLDSIGGPVASVKTLPQGATVTGDPPKFASDYLINSHFLTHLVYSVSYGKAYSEQVRCSGLEADGPMLNLYNMQGTGSFNARTGNDTQIWQLVAEAENNYLLGPSITAVNLQVNQYPNLLGVIPQQQHPTKFVHSVFAFIRGFFSTLYHGSPHRKPTLSLEVGANSSLDPEGSKLVQVLHTLNNNYRKTFQLIQHDLHSLVDEIEYISTPVVQRNQTTLEFYQQLEGLDEVAFSMNQMSSGTAQILVLLTQLHTAPPNSLILLEEVESMLHPSAQAKLTSILVAESATKTIILSTHSPIIASQSKSDSVKLVKKHRGATSVTSYNDKLAEEIINEMGIRPSFAFETDKVVFVEGEYDEAVYKHWLQKYDLTDVLKNGTLIDAQGYTKIQFYANARLLTRKVVSVDTYAVFDGDTKEKGDYKQAVQLLDLKLDHVLELKARNLESLLSNASAIRKAFPLLPLSEAEIADEFEEAGDVEASLKGALKRVLRTVGGYTAGNAVLIASQMNPPAEWTEFFSRIG